MSRNSSIRWALGVRRATLCCLTLAALPTFASETTLTVVDPQNRPIPNAQVTGTCDGQAVDQVTNAVGELHLPSNDCTLTARAPGFASARTTISAGDDDPTIRLQLATARGEITVSAGLPDMATEDRLTADDLARIRAGDAGEILRHLPGGAAVRRGPINLEPNLRGLAEDQVASFVDGTRTFAAGPARMDSNVSHVSPRMVQDLRVVKGPYALTWGAGTLSALRLETPRPDFQIKEGFEWSGLAGLGWGENGSTLDALASVQGSSERFRFYLGAGQRSGDDYEAGDGTEVPADYRSQDLRWRFGFRPNNHLLLELVGGYQEQHDIDYPGRLLDATYFYTRSHALQLTWNGSGTVSEVHAQLYSNRKDHLMNNDEKPTARDMPGRTPPFALEVALPTESNTTGGRLRLTARHGEVTGTYGIDGYRVEQTATRFVSRRSNGFLIFEDAVWPDATLENLGAYGQWVYGGDGYRLGAALRVDAAEATAEGLSPFFLANTVGDPDQDDTLWSAALSFERPLNSHWTLHLGLGRAVRAPTVLERYSDRFPATRFQLAAEFLGNPELDPEASLEFDLGLTARKGDLFFEVSLFAREIDDYITVVADPTVPKRLPLSPPVVYRYINGDGATFRGGELRLAQRLGSGFSWRADLAYVWAEDEAFDEPAIGIAPLTGEVALRYTLPTGSLWFDLGLRFADGQDRVATQRFEQTTPGWTVLDVLLAWQPRDTLGLRLGVRNLTDRRYSDHLNSPNPFNGQRILEVGRQIEAGVELRF